MASVGRTFTEADRETSEPVVIVSEEFARAAWPGGEDPIGRRVKPVRPGSEPSWMTVVGLVRDVKEDRFNARIDRAVWYVPYAAPALTNAIFAAAGRRVRRLPVCPEDLA